MYDVFNSLNFEIHGGGHGGVATLVGDFLAFLDETLALPPAEMFAALMPGLAAMGNLHPVFVHFPIAFLLGFFVLDSLASLAGKDHWRTIAGWLLYLGTLGAAVAVGFGLHAAATVPHGENVHAIMERHEHFGLTVLSLAVLLSLWRWLGRRCLHGAINGFYLLIAGIMAACLSLGADLGGLMVYYYGINVGTVVPPADVLQHQHGNADDDGEQHGEDGD